MPGRHVNDHQMRLFMRLRQNDSVALAGAKAGFSPATSYRLDLDPRLPSQRAKERGRRRQLHHAVSRTRPPELSIVQTLRHKHEPGAVPDQELYPVRPARPEDKKHTRKGIESEFALDQRGEAHHSLPEVYGLRRDQHFERSRRDDHALTCTASSTRSI